MNTVLTYSQPDDGESSRAAARAVRRLGDSVADSTLPSDIARPIALLEPLLHEVEETLRLAAEATGGASTSGSAHAVAEQFGQASATTVMLRLHLEQITTRLRGYDLDFPAEAAELSPRAAAAQRSTPAAGPVPRSAQPQAPAPASVVVTSTDRSAARR
ncbi:hypothetical protein [Kitasatospora sp. NPDC098663]|uniref:hypothetical protein n=1 Tax=Kitasatospora sp. NPDC098663 TaxID=3364096 RepID=UPI0037FC7CE5